MVDEDRRYGAIERERIECGHCSVAFILAEVGDARDLYTVVDRFRILEYGRTSRPNRVDECTIHTIRLVVARCIEDGDLYGQAFPRSGKGYRINCRTIVEVSRMQDEVGVECEDAVDDFVRELYVI